MPEQQTTPKTIISPEKRKRRRGRGFLNFLLIIGIIAAVSLFAWAEQQRRAAVKSLKQTEQELEEIRKSTQRSGDEVARQVLEKVRKHINVPNEPQPTVATIIDVERLRQNNEFYKQAENGDHLIITQQRAILYNAGRDLIIDVVPVRLDVQPSPAPAEEKRRETVPQSPQIPRTSPAS